MNQNRTTAVMCWCFLFATSAGAGEAATLSLRFAKIGGWAMARDGVTLIISQPTREELVYIDTSTGKEIRRQRVDFQPACLAIQADTLFASASASSIVYALDLKTGREMQKFRLPGEPVGSLACHPLKGPLFAANSNEEVLMVDPASGKVTSTPARGMFLAVDPRKGEFLYTGTNRPGVNEYIEVSRGAGDTSRLRFITVRETAALRKYAVQGQTLRLVAGNANAAYGDGGALHVSPDGSKIALAAQGGWYPAKGDRPKAVIAVFSTDDLTTTIGQVDAGSRPENIAFHPNLDMGVALSDGSNLTFFKAESLTKRTTLRTQRLPYATRHDMLTFGGKGKTVVFLQGENLLIVPLEGGVPAIAATSPSSPGASPATPGPSAVKPGAKDETPTHPVFIKDKKSIWFLDTAAPEATYISDRDYAIAKLPKELKNASLLVRTSGDVGDDGLPIGKIAALRDCTLYVAIQWDPTAKQGVSKNDFRRLAAAGWKEMPWTLETTGSTPNAEWKILSKPLEEGSVTVELRLPKYPRTHIVFLFQSASSAGGPAAKKSSTGSKTPSDKPAASPVAIKDKKSVWFLEAAAPEAQYISDRDYAIAKLPKELKNASMLVRTSTDVIDSALPIGRIAATADCTMYVAIQWDPSAKQGVSKNDFRRLVAAGWKEVEGAFETTGSGENFEWKLLHRPLEKGSVSVELRLPQPQQHVVFFFK